MPSKGARSYFDEIITKPQNSSLDAFGRIKISQQNVQLSAKQIHDDLAGIYFDTAEVSGAGTSHIYDKPNARSVLSVSAGQAGHRVRQSYQRFNYQAGKGQSISMTYNFQGIDAGVIKRCGYFDDNNGLFLQVDSTDNYSFNVRKNGVDTKIPQVDWSYAWGFPAQSLSFSGRGLILDPAAIGIFNVDFEWLGSGSVRFGFQINGAPIWIHNQNYANSAQSVYMQTPNLPVRYEIIADGTNGASTMDCICATVGSDGGQDLVGTTLSIDKGTTGLLSATGINPLLSFRGKVGYEGSVLIPLSYSILNAGNQDYRYGIIRNPTVAGVDPGAIPANWISVDGTGVEYLTLRDNTNLLSGGFQIHSGYSEGRDTSLAADARSIIRPGWSIAGDPDEFVLFVEPLGANDTYYGSMEIRELT